MADNDVVGTWRMTTNSLALLVRDGFRPAPTNEYTLTFKADHTCFVQSVESFVEHRYVSASGTWKLEHDTDGKKNALRFDLSVDGGIHIWRFGFAHEHGALILWSYHGDPDQWEFIEYRKHVTAQ